MGYKERGQIIKTFLQWSLGYPICIEKIADGQFTVQTDHDPRTVFLYDIGGGSIKTINQDKIVNRK